jgi:hypothetical protein
MPPFGGFFNSRRRVIKVAAQKFTTKGIKHAALLVPASGGGAPVEHDIKAIQFLQFSFDTTQDEVWGDDSLLTTWISALKGTLQMKTSYLDPAILGLITGDVVTTTDDGVLAQVDKIYLGAETVYTMSPVMLMFQITSRDENEVARLSTIYFFSAQMSNDPIPDGMDSKGISLFTWDFTLKPMATDETGASITPVNAIARLEIGPV